MASRRRTPLPRLMLTHQRGRFLLSLTGVAFAVFLILIEMGFMHGIYDSQTRVLKLLDADLLMMSAETEAFYGSIPFRRARLVQTLAHPEVVEVCHVVQGSTAWHQKEPAKSRLMRAFAFDPDCPTWRLEGLGAYLEDLQRPDTVVVDADAMESYFLGIGDLEEAHMNRRRVEILGSVELGPNLSTDGHIFTSDRHIYTLLTPYRARGGIKDPAHFGLLKLAEGASPERVARDLSEMLPNDVKFQTHESMIASERAYWSKTQSIAAIFSLGMIAGFAIGCVICYQILYTDLVDHLPEFATLKAIGYGNGRLVRMVLTQGWMLAALAFVPGVLAAQLSYFWLADATGLTIELTPERLLQVLVATFVMCTLASLIAVGRVLRTDPADVF